MSWIADLVLRQDGPAVYDQWVDHQIPFTDKRIAKAFDDVSQILLNPSYVNAGIGGVSSINTATTPRVASALESGKCALTHQPSSFVNQLTDASGKQAVDQPARRLLGVPAAADHGGHDAGHGRRLLRLCVLVERRHDQGAAVPFEQRVGDLAREAGRRDQPRPQAAGLDGCDSARAGVDSPPAGPEDRSSGSMPPTSCPPSSGRARS